MPERDSAVQDQIVGSVKETVGSIGNAIGINNDLQQDGKQQRKEGDVEYEAAQTEDAAKAKKDQIKGSLKENVGGIFSDKQKQEGKMDKAKGDALEEKSKV